MVCVKGVPGETGTIGKANSHLTQPKRGRVPLHHVEAAVDWCSTRLIANQAELLTPCSLGNSALYRREMLKCLIILQITKPKLIIFYLKIVRLI